MITASEDGTARLYDVEGSCLQAFSGHLDTVTSATLSRDGGSLLTTSADNTAKLFLVQSGFCRHTFAGHTGCVTSVSRHCAPVDFAWSETLTSKS